MRFILRQKVFSLNSRFAIKDEEERDAYYVEGEFFTIGNKLSFQDTSGRELLYIKQKVFSLITTYEIYKNNQVYATVQKEPFTLFRPRFNIELADGSAINVQGNFIEHEYEFAMGSAKVASVSKQFFSWTDTYGIDVAPEVEHELILACAVVIDMISHNGKK